MNKIAAKAKPFIKWAGGKTQLLNTIEEKYPSVLVEGKIKRYIEPFVGSGAVLFNILNNKDKFHIEEVYIWDVNPELITVYKTIKSKDIYLLIDELDKLQNEFLSEKDKEIRKVIYYNKRNEFNSELEHFDFENYDTKAYVRRSSLFIFLNRTCFNGLFRVNKSGQFNVPMGDYKNPQILNKENLLSAHELLQNVVINTGDYRESKKYVNNNTFVYFDPPYRPLNETSSFTSYSKFDFNDQNQIELAKYFSDLDELGAYLMLSNSDPKNTNVNDDFFDNLYKNFNIYRVSAKRNINSKANLRGSINELLITNY